VLEWSILLIGNSNRRFVVNLGLFGVQNLQCYIFIFNTIAYKFIVFHY
jgi:hypothetical protein